MQQASSSSGNHVPTSGNPLPPAAASPRFVVNLCASTTPVALVQPSHTGLKRYTFFVSRRLEEGRERFRLHMGYFDSQEEAEKMLDLVRDVYPAAWAGAAPGIKLRARAATAMQASQAGQGAPQGPPVPAPVAARTLAATQTPVPAAHAAAPDASSLKLELVADMPRARPAAQFSAAPEANAASRSLSDIRATIDSLSDATPAAKPVIEAQGLEAAAVLRLLESARPAPAARVAPATPAAHAAAAARTPVAIPARSVPMATPVTQPAVFAVQLLWSVQAIDMNQVPQLAIFSAYTLYGAEGNRDGRRWYGLRLGFFTDAVSAKQVAQYVRSEFTSVSVVPVTTRERDRAGAATAKPLPAIPSAKRTGPELNFIEDVPTDTATSGSRPALKLPAVPASPAASASGESAGVRAAAAALGLTTGTTPGKRTKLRVAQGTKPVSKRPAHDRPLSLEETLEILGAGDLQVDNGRGERVNDASLRERKSLPPSGSRFSRLINRLAERLGNN